MTTLLVMTVGQTDVQLVVNDQRHKLDGNTCGTLHDAIKERSWSVIDAPTGRSRDLIKTLPEADLVLCTPKLDAVLAHFGEAPPSSVLIFETNRQGARDPRMAGEVMKSRLRARGVGRMTCVAFLTGTEQLEDPTNDIEAVVRHAVVARLSNAIGEQIKALTTGDRVVVATTGGLAAANELINELVRLHAVGGPTVTALEVPDGNRAQQDDRAVPEKFHPAAGYRARWHALSLIEGGNLLGAWGAVSHLANEPGQGWVKVVVWLRCFASSLPLHAECDIELLSQPRMAVHAGLRVELALRAGDIPRAIHGTVAFFEAALWDCLRQRDFAEEDGATGSLAEGFTFTVQPTGEKRGRFCKRNETWRINDFKKGVDPWLAVMNKPRLKALWDALTDDIRNLRNDAAHNEPTSALMDGAKKTMRDAKLWSEQDTFLSQPLVQDVLSELGVDEPQSLLDVLFEHVRERLRHVPQPTEAQRHDGGEA